MIELNASWPQIIAIFLGIIFPLLVGLVTKRVTSGAVKGLLLTAISVVAGLLAEISDALINGTSFDVIGWLVVTLSALVAGQVSYDSIWKPTGAATALQEVGTKR